MLFLWFLERGLIFSRFILEVPFAHLPLPSKIKRVLISLTKVGTEGRIYNKKSMLQVLFIRKADDAELAFCKKPLMISFIIVVSIL